MPHRKTCGQPKTDVVSSSTCKHTMTSRPMPMTALPRTSRDAGPTAYRSQVHDVGLADEQEESLEGNAEIQRRIAGPSSPSTRSPRAVPARYDYHTPLDPDTSKAGRNALHQPHALDQESHLQDRHAPQAHVDQEDRGLDAKGARRNWAAWHVTWKSMMPKTKRPR